MVEDPGSARSKRGAHYGRMWAFQMINDIASWVSSASPFLHSLLVVSIPGIVGITILFERTMHDLSRSSDKTSQSFKVVPVACVVAIIYGLILGWIGLKSFQLFNTSFSRYTVYGYFTSMFCVAVILQSSISMLRSDRNDDRR